MQQIKLGLKRAATERPAFVMGIVNVTPDSFYEKSRGGIERALQLIDEGADILDIGGIVHSCTDDESQSLRIVSLDLIQELLSLIDPVLIRIGHLSIIR